jgi:uncharacterized membrane protein YeiH
VIAERLLYLANMAGIAVFAISGALSAGRKSFDLLGVLIIAFATALGGGTVRDLLLDRHPIGWIQDPTQLIVITVAAALTVIVTWAGRRPSNRVLLVADALGLALFAIGGAQIAAPLGSPVITVVMVPITGVAGGLIRDVLSAEVPVLLKPTEIYATTAIIGISSYLALERLGLGRDPAALIGMGIIAILRTAAIVFRIRLPAFTIRNET